MEFCKKLFASYHHVRYITNNGMSLNEVEDNDVDFVWSYDSFVHMDKDTIGNYLGEIYRVLKPEGKAVIHHPGRTHTFLWLGFMMSWGKIGTHIYNSPYAEPGTGVSVRKVENAEWRALR